jgi:hypothetical protein
MANKREGGLKIHSEISGRNIRMAQHIFLQFILKSGNNFGSERQKPEVNTLVSSKQGDRNGSDVCNLPFTNLVPDENLQRIMIIFMSSSCTLYSLLNDDFSRYSPSPKPPGGQPSRK